MVRVVQRVGKEIFYNYLSKLGFGKMTEIELAEEKAGFVDNETTVSAARFLNNSFGQGLQTTQIQLAAAYASLVNGGRYIKPTIVS
jgi:cell division protein FtsI/penicillin-binding protein 2